MNRRIAYLSTSLLPRMMAAGISSPARLALLCLCTHPETTTIGVNRSGTDQLSVETGQPRSTVRRALAELEEAGFLIRDLATGEIYLPSVMAGLDEARHVQITDPIDTWWIDTGYQSDHELRNAPIASERIRAAAAADLRRVAS